MMEIIYLFFQPEFQMSVDTILKFIVVICILYLGYQLMLKHSPLSTYFQESNDILPKNDTFMNYSPAAANLPDTVPMPIVEGPRTIVGSGPNAPSQAAPLDTIRVTQEPGATDPYAEPNEDANARENLRHPERMFRPAPQMDAVEQIPDSGIGGSPDMQQFAPEFAQNGGEFMNGIFANDLDTPTNFSMF